MKFPTEDQVIGLTGEACVVQAMNDLMVATKARETVAGMRSATPQSDSADLMEFLAESLELRAEILAYTATPHDLPEDMRVRGLTATTEAINHVLEAGSRAYGLPSLVGSPAAES